MGPQNPPYGQGPGGPPPGYAGGPPPGYAGGPPPGYGPGSGDQPGYPGGPMGPGGPQGQYGAPPQNTGPMGNFANRLPQSAPGTLFGVPLAKLRDVSVQRMALTFLGIALLASIFVPISLSPFQMAFKGNAFRGLVWPALAGAAYLLVAIAPPNLRNQVPPVVLQWLPFGVSYAGVLIAGLGLTFAGTSVLELIYYPDGGTFNSLYPIGMSTLIFGLLARLQNPHDQTARIIIAIGAGCLVIPFFGMFKFDGPALIKVHNILFLLVMLVGIACLLFVVPPQKLPPALRSVDAFAPHVTAVLLLWLPLQIVLLGLAMIVHKGFAGMNATTAFLLMARSLLALVAYFGVLMLTAPAAYDSLMDMLKSRNQGGPPGGYPPGGPGGGYPPPGGGYPPPGYGDPQGGGFPPQGGPGYGGPQQGGPQGGGYPPPGGGGGWPPPS